MSPPATAPAIASASLLLKFRRLPVRGSKAGNILKPWRRLLKEVAACELENPAEESCRRFGTFLGLVGREQGALMPWKKGWWLPVRWGVNTSAFFSLRPLSLARSRSPGFRASPLLSLTTGFTLPLSRLALLPTAACKPLLGALRRSPGRLRLLACWPSPPPPPCSRTVLSLDLALPPSPSPTPAFPDMSSQAATVLASPPPLPPRRITGFWPTGVPEDV